MTSIHFPLVSTLLSNVNCEPPPTTHTHTHTGGQSCRALPKTQPGCHIEEPTLSPPQSVPRAFPTWISPAAPTTHLTSVSP